MRGSTSHHLPVLQAGPLSPEASFVGDLEGDTASASGSQSLSCASASGSGSGDAELDAIKPDTDVDMEQKRDAMSPSPAFSRTRSASAGKGKGKAARPKLSIRSGGGAGAPHETPPMAINHSHPPTHAQNGLMSPPTPAPSPTPGRNGWWGTVPRGPMQALALGAEQRVGAGGLELDRGQEEGQGKVEFGAS